MDIGVGAFVLSSAVVSRQARNSNIPPSVSHKCRNSLRVHVLQTLTKVSPLLVLGLLRLVVHSSMNYQAHVSEYGVHWNFFFTMAVVALLAVGVEHASPLVSALLLSARASPPQAHLQDFPHSLNSGSEIGSMGESEVSATSYIATGLAVATCYQALLVTPLPRLLFDGPQMTLQHYVLYAPRDATSFVSQNREGLTGVIGFFAVYLCGVAIGRHLLDPRRRTVSQWRRFAWHAALLCSGLWLLFACSCAVAGPVSRRLVNLPYVVWVIAFNSSQLLGFLVTEIITTVYTMNADELDARDMVAAAAVHGETGVPASALKGSKLQHNRLRRKISVNSASSLNLIPGGDGDARALRHCDADTDGNSSEHSDDSAQHEGDTGSSPSRLRSPGILRRSIDGGDVDLQRVRPTSKEPPLRAQVFNTSPSHTSSDEHSDASSISGQRSDARCRDMLHRLSRLLFTPLPEVPRVVINGGSLLVDAFNANFLAIFVLANLLVGVTNLLVETLDVPAPAAVLILLLYMGAICFAAVAWRMHLISLKIW